MNKSDLKQLIREEIQGVLSENKLNMQKVYKILKTAGYDPKISEGNRLFIKSIKVTGKGNTQDYGTVKITPSGTLYGDDLWGMDIKSEEEIIPAIEEFVKDQKSYLSEGLFDIFKKTPLPDYKIVKEFPLRDMEKNMEELDPEMYTSPDPYHEVFQFLTKNHKRFSGFTQDWKREFSDDEPIVALKFPTGDYIYLIAKKYL